MVAVYAHQLSSCLRQHRVDPSGRLEAAQTAAHPRPVVGTGHLVVLAWPENTEYQTDHSQHHWAGSNLNCRCLLVRSCGRLPEFGGAYCDCALASYGLYG